MKMKTSELTGAALDWAVQQCEGARKDIDFVWWTDDHYSPSTDWAQGGPIIEREKIKTSPYHNQGEWWAEHAIAKSVEQGPTPLIAAMRCYVASKLGDEVEISEELTK